MPFERVKQFKDLMVDYDSSAAGATVKTYTDMPGGTMSLRNTYILPQTTGRQTKNVPLDGIEGTLIKFTFTPAGAGILKVYGGTLRMRPVGVYLDGANGETWSTQEMGFGV